MLFSLFLHLILSTIEILQTSGKTRCKNTTPPSLCLLHTNLENLVTNHSSLPLSVAHKSGKSGDKSAARSCMRKQAFCVHYCSEALVVDKDAYLPMFRFQSCPHSLLLAQDKS